MSYEHEQELQQTRNLVENYNQLSDETRDKLAKGVEWLAFLQKMSAPIENNELTDDEPAKAAV